MTIVKESPSTNGYHGPAPLAVARPVGKRSRPTWSVRNKTPRPIWLEHGGRVFTLAPLEERGWRASPADRDDPREVWPDLSVLEDRRQVEISRHRADRVGDPALATAIHVTLIAGFLWLASFWPLTPWWWLRSARSWASARRCVSSCC